MNEMLWEIKINGIVSLIALRSLSQGINYWTEKKMILIFKMAAQSVGNVGNVVVLRKGFFETLEDGTSVKR